LEKFCIIAPWAIGLKTLPKEEDQDMGLFDFVASIGKKIFASEAEAADKIKGWFEGDNPGVDDFKVTVKDGIATISGEAASAEAKEKAVLMVGNLQGVNQVNADNLKSPAASQKVEYYVIKSGDTLSAIAQHYYGKGSAYPRIFEANREVIKDPDLIYPGQKIRIPMD
jgi:nucleoid-associated protein YgaU